MAARVVKIEKTQYMGDGSFPEEQASVNDLEEKSFKKGIRIL